MWGKGERGQGEKERKTFNKVMVEGGRGDRRRKKERYGWGKGD